MRIPVIKSKFQNSGYSILELAIILVIVGVVLMPALGLYSLYVQRATIDKTEGALLETRRAIVEFRDLYGRYPCPARADRTPGDADYGYESRDTGTGMCVDVANGVWEAESNNVALSNRDVFIGSIPFRQMNLPEQFAHDGHNNRLTYAVTGVLADDATYNPASGGLTIIDENDDMLTTPAHTGHYVVLSHGDLNAGAISREGAELSPCATAAAPEQENCDRDAVFRAGAVEPDFDDLVYYSVSESVGQWQLSEASLQNIHLRRSDTFAVGANESTNTSGFAAVEVKTVGSEDGTMVVEQGSVISNQICDKSGTDCFPAQRIAGQIAEGEGMDCSPDFLVGVSNGQPICRSEVFFSCPAGTFVAGFDVNGKLICNVEPPTQCPDQTLSTTCLGPDRNVSAFFFDDAWYGYAYAGMCHKIQSLDTAQLSAMTSLSQVRSYVDSLNNSTRTSVDCGPNSNTALTRDTFECQAGGVWNTSPVHTIERIKDSGSVFASHPPLNNPVPRPAEPGVGVWDYDPADPMSVDEDNTSASHDCWCREDYRVQTQSCPGDATGTRYKIEKHKCPATTHTWTQAYPASGYSGDLCGCTPGSTSDSVSCKSYYGYSGPGIDGNVTRYYDIVCPGGPSGAPQRVLSSTISPNPDTSQCRCPNLPDENPTDPCPTGTINSFTFNGKSYANVSKVYEKLWSCPGGPAPVQPISSAADAGSYGPKTLLHTEACVCDTALTKDHTAPCPAGYTGSGKHYVLPWNCATMQYEEPSESNLVENACRECIWQGETRRPGISDTAAPVERFSACPSCTNDTETCYEQVGDSAFEIYENCTCTGRP